MTQKLFEELEISSEVKKAIKELGFEECTPIQEQAIPVLLAGRDIVGQAQTGTGKTMAFGIPIVEKIDASSNTIQAIILCPTRELAIQVSEEITKIIKFTRIKVLPIYGGQPIERQLKALRQGIHIVIATPGRLMDHIERKTILLNNIKAMVLDEADEMLDMGFREDIESILKSLPVERQTIFFSATMPKQIRILTQTYQNNPIAITVEHKELTVSNIDQKYVEITERNKTEALTRFMEVLNPELALVFCNTKRKVNDIVSALQARGYFADGLHGDLKQNERTAVMEKFKKGIVDILVATDVAARGLDIQNVEAVFNLDLPLDEESYVHRIGRTGRAGKNGTAISFVTGREMYQLRDIERYTKSKIKNEKIPTANEVEEIKVTQLIEDLKIQIEEGHLTKYTQIVEELINENFSVVEIAAVLLKNALGKTEASKEDITSKSQTRAEVGGKDHFSGSTEGMQKIFINVGRNQKIQVKELIELFMRQGNLNFPQIGKIKLHDQFSFVEVPNEMAIEVVNTLNNSSLRGRKVFVEIAKGKSSY